jgi:cell wall-associated NlpC family hydrolase
MIFPGQVKVAGRGGEKNYAEIMQSALYSASADFSLVGTDGFLYLHESFAFFTRRGAVLFHITYSITSRNTMKKFLFKFLIMAILVAGVDISLAGLAYGSPPKRTTTTLRKAHKGSKKKRSQAHRRHSKNRHRRGTIGKSVPKEQSLTVLREYLPQYADLHETKSPNAALLPVPSSFDTRSPYRDPSLRIDLISNISRWLGTRYRFGGSSRRGIDCSGFTSAIVRATLKNGFAGSSRVMAERFVPITRVDSLQFGDLIFFTGRNKRSDHIGHVGIFIGNGVFAHSSTGRGVIYTHISQGYYLERFRCGGRFLDQQLTASVKHDAGQVH